MTRLMTHQQVGELVSALVLSQSGWNDAAVDATAEQIRQRWTNPDAAAEAIRNVCDSWTNPGRPPWGVLHEAYRTACRRVAMDTPAIEGTPSRIVSISEGRQIAARSYAAECRRRDPNDVHIRSGFRTNEPNPEFLDRLLGITH